LNYALEITKTKKAELARAIDQNPQLIQYLCTKARNNSPLTFEIATALGITTKWLATGEGEIFPDILSNSESSDFKKAYLLNPQNIIQALEQEKDLETISTEGLDWVIHKTDKKVFCINTPDSSMSPLISQDSLLIFEPSLSQQAKNGDLVLVYLKKHKSLLARKLLQTSKGAVLTTENPELYRTIPYSDDALVFGVVKEIRRKL
jgi:phage repressor protein C with HTH and peptisase S24 domain